MNRFAIVNPATGDLEVFDTRISRDGFEEWVQQRDALRAAGRPDRPPDVDTDTLQAWVPHPGEEDHPWHVAHPPTSPDDPFPVYVVWWVGPAGRTTLRVQGQPDGAFDVEVGHINADGMKPLVGREYPKEMSPDAVWRDIEERIVELSAMHGDVGALSIYSDWVLLEAEQAVARADVARGFVIEMAEGIVQ